MVASHSEEEGHSNGTTLAQLRGRGVCGKESGGRGRQSETDRKRQAERERGTDRERNRDREEVRETETGRLRQRKRIKG